MARNIALKIQAERVQDSAFCRRGGEQDIERSFFCQPAPVFLVVERKRQRIETNDDLFLLPWLQKDSSNAFELLARSAHGGSHVPNVDLNDFCPGNGTGISNCHVYVHLEWVILVAAVLAVDSGLSPGC